MTSSLRFSVVYQSVDCHFPGDGSGSFLQTSEPRRIRPHSPRSRPSQEPIKQLNRSISRSYRRFRDHAEIAFAEPQRRFDRAPALALPRRCSSPPRRCSSPPRRCSHQAEAVTLAGVAISFHRRPVCDRLKWSALSPAHRRFAPLNDSFWREHDATTDKG